MAKPCCIAGSPDKLATGTAPLALPPEQALVMPRQSLHAPGTAMRSHPGLWPRISTLATRVFLLCATVLVSAYGISEMYAVVVVGNVTWMQWLFLALFAINFCWISFAGWQAVLGFLVILKQDLLGRHHPTTTTLTLRTAILVPVYNEEPARIVAAIKAMLPGLGEPAAGRFAIFILSDTNQPRAFIQEEQAYHDLIKTSTAACPLWYRHRRHNTERKAGNIADWVMRWGAGFDAMLVLDADSIMSPATIIEMARRLEADPGLGLLQSLPSIVMAKTLYGRLQQFANRLYGPVFANGLAAWHGNSSNFWGHNAIIRTQAFAAASHLPVLKGSAPFGGHLISHDFIEAALLRRAGWAVRFDTDLQESFEEAPPSVSDVLIRDRRWCQGNLQHSRLLFARGLSFVSRLHLLSGIMSYVSALFWLLFLVTGLVLAVQAGFTPTEYFSRPSLFPTWPLFDAARAITLFMVSISIVLLPKVLAWASAMLNFRRCRLYGGPVLLTLSVVTESLLSALFAPVMMLAQSVMVAEILTGGDSGWKPQRRSDGSISLASALRSHQWHMLTGILAAGLTWLMHPDLFWWMVPVTAPLVLSALLSWASGKVAPGRMLGLLGILGTPEERLQPPIVQAVIANLQDGEDEQHPGAVGTLASLFADPDFYAWHWAQLRPVAEGSTAFNPAQIVAQAKVQQSTGFTTLAPWLNQDETMAVLHSKALLEDIRSLYALSCPEHLKGDSKPASSVA